MRHVGSSLSLRLWLFVVLVLGRSIGVQGQEGSIPDHWSQLWLDATVKGRLAERLKGIGGMGYRTGDELGRGKQFYLNGELRYKLHRIVDAGFEQRAVFRPDAKDRHRTGFMLSAEERFGRTTLSYRLNYQHIWLRKGEQRDVIRNKFGAEYDIKGVQFDPEFSVEFFTVIGSVDPGYDAVRYKLGTSWKPRKGQRLSFALVHDREQNRRRPDYRWIFAFSYAVDLGKV